MARREESPDTVVVGSQEPVTKDASRADGVRPAKGNAPGNARGAVAKRKPWLASSESPTESATENIPPAEQHGDICAGKPARRLRIACFVW
jgi:hypothetical protein